MSSEVRTAENESVRFEESDFRVGVIGWFFSGLALGLVLTGALVGGLLWLFLSSVPPARTQAPAPEGTRIQAPLLQPDAAADLRESREQSRRWLSGYGWVDRTAGIVHIPVERAMRVLVERGMPGLRTIPDSPEIPPVKSAPSIPPPVQRRDATEADAP